MEEPINVFPLPRPPRDNSECCNLIEAAAFLGVNCKTLAKWRDLGFVRGFYLPGKRVPHPTWRVRREELLRLITEGGWRKPRRFIDPRTTPTIPVCMIARLADVSEQNVQLAKIRGTLSDYTFDSVRQWLLRRERRRLRAQERKKLIDKYERKLGVLRADTSRLRRILRSERCAECRKKPILRRKIARII